MSWINVLLIGPHSLFIFKSLSSILHWSYLHSVTTSRCFACVSCLPSYCYMSVPYKPCWFNYSWQVIKWRVQIVIPIYRHCPFSCYLPPHLYKYVQMSKILYYLLQILHLYGAVMFSANPHFIRFSLQEVNVWGCPKL